jgi:hypothetical protein
MIKRKFAQRPNRQIYKDYKGILGEVVGVSEKLGHKGRIQYEVKCIDCGEIHLRDSKHLKQGINSQECKFYKPPNWSGLEKEDSFIRRKYGITLEQYYELLKIQNNGCAICGRAEEPDGRRLAIDHCHSSGDVRGVLCNNCNNGLGSFGDSIDGMLKAIEYLKNPPINSLAR